MASFIDRDPEQMLRYAKDVKTVIGEMTMIIRKVEGLLDSCASELDDPTRKQIEELHRCCAEYFKQIDVYQNIADTVAAKGKKLAAIRNEG